MSTGNLEIDESIMTVSYSPQYSEFPVANDKRFCQIGEDVWPTEIANHTRYSNNLATWNLKGNRGVY